MESRIQRKPYMYPIECCVKRLLVENDRAEANPLVRRCFDFICVIYIGDSDVR